MKRYKCRECGYIHMGDESPSVCPVCGYDSEVFFLMDDVEDKKIEFVETIDTDNIDIIKLLRRQFDDIARMIGISESMNRQALSEKKEDDALLFQEATKVLLNQSAISSMLLGEFLEFNTESNRVEMKKKLEKEVKRMIDLKQLLSEEGNTDYDELIDSNIESLNKISSKF